MKSIPSSKTVRNQVLAAIKAATENNAISNAYIEKSDNFGGVEIATEKYQVRDLVNQFVSATQDYKAVTEIVGSDQIAMKLREMISGCPVRRMVVPSGIDPAWTAELRDIRDIEVVTDDGFLPIQQLAQFDGVITGSSYSLASSGTIVLTSAPSEGRRALSLLPDYHFCVVRAESILARVMDLFTIYKSDSPLTLISGPSATSDIELSRVEGVHGPRNLFVLVVWDG